MQVLLAWSQNTVLVSFRGTASLANALADIQVSSLFPNFEEYLPCYSLLSKTTHLTHCLLV